MDPIVAYYNHINGLSCSSPSCCEGSAAQSHHLHSLYASDMPQAQYARVATPRLTTIEPPPTRRTKRRAFQPRCPARLNAAQNQFVAEPAEYDSQGMRTFWQDEDDHNDADKSRTIRHKPSSTRPINCILDLAPQREDSSSPLTASSWSSDHYNPLECEKNADVALITCHNNVQIADAAWTTGLPHKARLWIPPDEESVGAKMSYSPEARRVAPYQNPSDMQRNEKL